MAVAAGFLLVEFVLRVSVLTLILPIFERRPPFNVSPPGRDPDAESVRFTAVDGVTLAGSLYHPAGEPHGLVVFCPEFGGTHWSAPAYVGGLIDAGFAVLAFDFRNQGDSDSEPGYAPTHWLTEKEVADALAALRYVAGRPDLAWLPLGMFGVSRGANAALVAAARSPHVQAVAAEGAFSTDAMMLYYAYRWAELYVPPWMVRLIPEWHLAETMRFARRVSGLRHGVRYAILERWLPRLAGRPVLLITGERDSYVAPVIAERIRSCVGPSCRAVWVVPGAKHNQARQTAPHEYDRRLVEFFEPLSHTSSAREVTQGQLREGQKAYYAGAYARKSRLAENVATQTTRKAATRSVGTEEWQAGGEGYPAFSSSSAGADPQNPIWGEILKNGLDEDDVVAILQIQGDATGKLTAEEAARLERLKRIIDAAIRLFEGDEGAARRWLLTPARGLGDLPPAMAARTHSQTEEAVRLIGRIEHGVVM